MMAATLPHQPAPAVSEQPSHMIEAQLSQPPFQPSSEQQLGPQAAQPACSTCAAARRDSVMPGSMARRMLIPSTKSQLRAVSTNQTFQSRLAAQLAALDRLQAAQPFGDPVLASALCRHFAVGALSTRNPSRVRAFQDRLEYDFKGGDRCTTHMIMRHRDMSSCKLQSQGRVLSFRIVTPLHLFTAYYNPSQADHRLSITFDALDEAAAVFCTLPHE